MDAVTIRKLMAKMRTVLSHPGNHAWNVARQQCPICRHPTVFVCDEATEPWIRRCIWCRSTPKYRAIRMVAEQRLGRRLEDVLDAGGAIYELSTTSPLFRRLSGRPGYVASGYFSDKAFGRELRSGVWNQDLQRLSFESGSFDLVVSSETMEHVRRPWLGFGEIHRVLKDGGLHVFTIPYREDRLTTARVDTSGPEDRHLLPPVYHLDPYRPEDSLVYTDFGGDLVELLRPLGFETEVVRLLDGAADVRDDLLPVTVFVSRKVRAFSA